MTDSPFSGLSADDELTAAAEQGRICALAAKGQRDLHKRATAHPDLFSGDPFDPALFSTVALAISFGAPWCTAEQLRVANRAVLWGFAVDWLIDYVAKSPDEVADLIAGCLTVADDVTASGTDPLARFLAELRDELATVPAFAALRPVWREELHRMLTAMAREWQWRAGDTGSAEETSAPTMPTFTEYLANADNLACSFVNVSHWIYTGSPETLAHLPELLAASAEVQRMLRLVNDLGTYERDVRWGDLNALMLVPDRAEVEQEINTLMARCQELLRPLRTHCPQEAVYLARQIGFSSGFYRLADFWGSL